jgi:hypothetical protein
LKLDYSLDAEGRKNLVDQIIKETPISSLSEGYIEILSNYIISAEKTKEILTDNRMLTIQKRETSYQGLVSQFENGEDGVSNLIIENDKNILLTPKIKITPRDVERNPDLKNLREAISIVQKSAEAATGKRKYKLKKQLIEMYQEQYLLKDDFHKTPGLAQNLAYADLSEHIHIDEQGLPHSDGIISFFNPSHISALLCNYSALKEETYAKFNTDM